MSASGRGRPWQNGYCERFFSTLKSELVGLKNVRDPVDLYEKVAIFIHYYNTKRIHTALKTSPAKFAKRIGVSKKPFMLIQPERVYHREVRRS